jgi:hypothetical protein
MDGLHRVIRRTNRMSGNMGRGHRLTCSTSGRASRTILPYVASSRMRIKRRLAYVSHLKHSASDPCLECFDSLARAVIVWILFLEIRQNTLHTVDSPDG